MRMRIQPNHSKIVDQSTVVRNRQAPSFDSADDSATGIAAIWLVFYLVVAGVVVSTSDMAAELMHHAMTMASLR